jgi:Protein of unknown function (DUF2848)
MLHFTRTANGRVDRIAAAIDNLVIAGWTGRDEKAISHHIEELAAIGVPRPSKVPLFYRVAATQLTQTTHLQALGPDSSGEVEPVVVSLADGLWLGLGSDHTDRKAETISVALSKQLCGKVIGTELWRLEEIARDWDKLILRAHAEIDGKRALYQEGPLAGIRPPDDLMTRYAGAGKALDAGTAMFCGTLGAKGGIRPATRFEMEIEDPVRRRSLRHAYTIEALPVIA